MHYHNGCIQMVCLSSSHFHVCSVIESMRPGMHHHNGGSQMACISSSQFHVCLGPRMHYHNGCGQMVCLSSDHFHVCLVIESMRASNALPQQVQPNGLFAYQVVTFMFVQSLSQLGPKMHLKVFD